MPEITEYPHGSPSWADHLAHDARVAKDFYTGLFGWTYDDHPAGEGMVYTMFSHNGVPVCASAEAGPMQQELPAHWSVYVTVDDLEAAIARSDAAGGTTIFGPCDVLDVGRMAIIQDKEGAFLRLWYPLKHAGAGKLAEPGAICWFELATTDVDSAKGVLLGGAGCGNRPRPRYSLRVHPGQGRRQPGRRHRENRRGLGPGSPELGHLHRR